VLIPKLAAYYVNTFGSDSERERYAAGALPEDELDALVYLGIWRLLLNNDTFHKRKRVSHEEVEKIAIMHRVAEPGDKVTFEVIEPADEFDAEEWAILKRLRLVVKSLVADAEPEVTPFWLIGRCGRKTLRRSYARVDLEIEGRPYKVEVCLK